MRKSLLIAFLPFLGCVLSNCSGDGSGFGRPTISVKEAIAKIDAMSNREISKEAYNVTGKKSFYGWFKLSIYDEDAKYLGKYQYIYTEELEDYEPHTILGNATTVTIYGYLKKQTGNPTSYYLTSSGTDKAKIINFTEVDIFGHSTTYKRCGTCSGSGYSTEKKNGTCTKCGGSGKSYIEGTICSTCGGVGMLLRGSCRKCGNSWTTTSLYDQVCPKCRSIGIVEPTRECYVCNGTGHKTGTCTQCNGAGNGTFDAKVECTHCHGKKFVSN